jgi:sensor histidine kinase YesM
MPSVNLRSRYWQRILLANTFGALAAVGIFGGLAPGAGWAAFFRGFGISLVFANCCGILLATGIPIVLGRCRAGTMRSRWPILLAAIVVLASLGTLLATIILRAAGVIPPGRFSSVLPRSLTVSLVISLVISAVITAYETVRGQLEETTVALRTKERDEAEARRLAAEAQLAALESRVQPHFLFNTLNSIAELIHRDPKGAEQMTTQLAALLRSSLDEEAGRMIPLADEVSVVRDYLEIERVRYGSRLMYTIDIEPEAASALVPRLSVQTLVENSIKFAVAPSPRGARVTVRATLRAGVVRIEIEDNGPGFDVSVDPPEGHGLALLRSRLAMAFGERAALRLNSRPGLTSVAIELPRA